MHYSVPLAVATLPYPPVARNVLNRYCCKYARKERQGDITIGDFIGLGEGVTPKEFIGNSENVSVILVNTVKGKLFLEACKKELNIFDRDIKEAITGGTSLQKPFVKHAKRDEFVEKYSEFGFVGTMKQIENLKELTNRNKYAFKRNVKSCILKYFKEFIK